jgi:hypothetical protein
MYHATAQSSIKMAIIVRMKILSCATNINQLQIHTHSKKIEEHESIDILCSIDSSETKGACGNLLTDLEAFSSPFCILS